MNTTELITILIACGSFLFVIIEFGFGRHDKNSDGLDEIKTSLLKANMKLDSVCATTSETRTDIKSLNRDIIAIEKRVTRLETKVGIMMDEEDLHG